MTRQYSIEEVVRHKKKALKKLNNTFEAFINNPEDSYKKKADILAYWLESYSEYLLREKAFDYSRVPSYKRGDVLLLDFGFNIGSEQGGLHYAVVLDNYNKQSSPVITVVPLSSGTRDSTYVNDVFLGNELYEKLISKYERMSQKCEEDLKEAQEMLNSLEADIEKVNADVSDSDFQGTISRIEEKVQSLVDERNVLKKYKKEISKLKQGSRALIGQITTVSKMRIYKPKNRNDLLYNIRLSDGAMDKINEKLKLLYIRNELTD